MATVASPESHERQTFTSNKPEPINMPPSVDPPVSTESFMEVKSETATEPPVNSLEFAPKPSADADTDAKSVAFLALAKDADQTITEAEGAIAKNPRHETDLLYKGRNDNTAHGLELLSAEGSASQDFTEETPLRRENGCPEPELSPATEDEEEKGCGTNVPREAGDTGFSEHEKFTNQESSMKEKSVILQKEAADGKNQEAAKPTEELSTQPKKRRMVCKECGKIFNRRETFNLHRHFHLHEDELKPLTCKECGLTFQQRSSFIKHRNEHKDNGNKPLSVKRGAGKGQEQAAFKCEECATVFFSLNKLRNHRCSHPEDVPFHCPICRQDFMYKMSITRHMFTHSKDRLQCAECDQTFSDSTSLRTHQHSHVSHKPYECVDCGMTFKQYSLMVDHRRKHTESSASFQCNVCSKSFKYIGLLHQHQYLHTGKKPFLCSQCGKTFAFSQNLKAHYRQHSLNTTITPTEKPKSNHCNTGQTTVKSSEKENIEQNKDVDARRSYNCPLCEQNFTTPANLRNHMSDHEAEYEMEETSTSSNESVTWDKANSSDVHSDELSLSRRVVNVHKSNTVMNVHPPPPPNVDYAPENTDTIRPFKCSQCEKSFRHRSVLELHKRVHSKDKQPQCKVCGKSFSMNSYLKQHMIIHTGKRPYKCSDCGKDFALLQSMRNHLKLHQEKPFRCNQCSKGYSDEAQLQRHVLSHNRDKPHKCHICEKRFALAHQLRDHINIHTGERPHHCEVCNKTFTWLSSLLVHQKNAHKRRGTGHFNSFPLGDSVSKSSIDLRTATLRSSRPFAGSDTDGLSVTSDSPAIDSESGKTSDQPPPSSAVDIDLKPQKKPVVSEAAAPVQWKVDGSEVMPAPSSQKTHSASEHFDNPSLSRPITGQTKETSPMTESLPIHVGSSPSSERRKTSPSSGSEIEQQRQLKTFPWSSPSTVASTSSPLRSEFTLSGAYIDGAALWSVRPTAPNQTSNITSKKATQELKFPAWQGAPMSAQKDLPSPKKEEGRTWDMGIPRAQTVSPSEKSWASGLQTVSSLAQMASHGIGTRWDIQTSPGLQTTLNSPERLALQKQLSSSWAGVRSPNTALPISIQYDPLRFSQAIGAPMWGFQSSPVAPQTMLKPGNVQELQRQQPMTPGTKIILNQPPPFFPLPPMTLPPTHPLHSVAVGALARPPLPNIFFPPQAVTQALSLPQLSAQREPHKLGSRLSFPPERLHQCMICGCSLPRELELQLHYMQHAQGKI